MIANVAYQAGLQFYDAMLPEVSHEGNRGKISGIGVGVGYLGSYIAIGLGHGCRRSAPTNKPFLFTMIACFFLLFALPCFLFVKERGNPNPRQVFSLAMLRESTGETIAHACDRAASTPAWCGFSSAASSTPTRSTP